jgi:23S rRNA pseudouridine2605 synthase
MPPERPTKRVRPRRPGDRPGERAGGHQGGKHAGKPGAAAANKQGGKPHGKRPRPGGHAAGKPRDKDERGGRAAGKPYAQPESKPSGAPRGKPHVKLGRRLVARPGGKPPPPKPAEGPDEPLRIAKAMARAGLCSRREAERWIEQGRVNVNGRLLTTPAFEVSGKDKVLIDGKPLPSAEPPQLWRYYKPRGLVTTHADPQGRPTVFESLPEGMPRVVSVGRLDFNSEGLLLLTNDGALSRHLELPATGWLRRYRVRAHGRVSQADLDKLKDGIEIEGVRYGPIEATLDSVQSGNAWLTMGLREGKNREVRRILAHLGVDVNRLIRISYGPFQLLDLKPGAAEPVKRHVLADQMGARIAAELNLNEVADEKRELRKVRNARRDDKA